MLRLRKRVQETRPTAGTIRYVCPVQWPSKIRTKSNGQYITNETRNQRQKQSTERLQSKVVHSVGAPAGFVYLEAFRIKRKSIPNLPHANRTCEFLRRLCLQSLGLDSFWSHHLQQYHEFKGAFGCQESWNTIFFF